MLNWRDMENPKHGGAECVTQAFMSDLVRRGHEVYWFTEAFDDCAPTAEFDGVHAVRGGRNVLSRYVAVRRWYKQQPPFDLVIDQHHGIPWYAPWWCKTRCIAYIHEVLGSIWNTFYHGWKAPVAFVGTRQERFTLWLYRNVTFWTICQATENALRKNGVKNIQRIPNGTDTVALDHLEPKTLQTPLKLVFVSRLAPNKRVDHAILTTKILRQRGIDTQLTIAGGGDSYYDLQRFVAQQNMTDAVRFTGRLSEDARNHLLQDAHFLIHTSVREGWGLNVIEANAMGTPAAVYPTEGLTESTLKNQTGIISEEETPQSLADTIQECLAKKEFYNQIRIAAWQRSKTFQWDKVLPIASDWLEKMASGK